MKVLFLGNAEQLAYEMAGRVADFENHTLTKELLDGKESYDVAVIQDKEVPIYELREVSERLSGAMIFYVVSYDVREQSIENKINTCRESDVIPIGPRLSNTQMVDQILRQVQGEDDHERVRKIVTFLGTHGRSGLSQTVLGTAAKLVEICAYSVVVLSLTSSNPPSVFFSNAIGITLNELYTQISNNRQVIKSGDLKNLLYEDPRGFHFLAGNQDYTKRNHYQLDDIEYLIDMLCSEFDIVLIDAGHDPDTALTIQALQKADIKFLNVTQVPTSAILWKKMYEDILDRYLGISPDEFQMIVNFYTPDIPKRDIKILESEFGMIEIIRIPDIGNEGAVCEVNKSLLYDLKRYRKVIGGAYQKLSMTILQRLDLLDEEQEAKKWFRRRA